MTITIIWHCDIIYRKKYTNMIKVVQFNRDNNERTVYASNVDLNFSLSLLAKLRCEYLMIQFMLFYPMVSRVIPWESYLTR